MKYVLNENNNLFLPEISKFYIHVDDGGANDNNLTGYSLLFIDSYTRNSLINKISAFYKKKKITELHAKKIKKSNYKKYKPLYFELLTILKNELQKANKMYMSSKFLESDNYKKDIIIIENFFENICGKLKISLTHNLYKKVFAYIAKPIVDFFQKKVNFAVDTELFLIYDRTSIFEKIYCNMIKTQKGEISFDRLMVITLNKFLKLKMNINSNISSIEIKPSENDKILQTMDIINNFALNHIRCSILEIQPSEQKKMKSELFVNFFNSCVVKSEFEKYFNHNKGKISSKGSENRSIKFELFFK